MKRKYLMTPGPSPVPSLVREASAREIMHHRTDEFMEILKDVHAGLKDIFCTKNPVLILASSGTGAMEAAVTNLCSHGDTILAVLGGKFGERWTEIGKAHGLNVIEMETSWGTSPSVDELKKILETHTDIKVVFTTLCETSTATVYDIEAIAKLTKSKGILLVVDAISGLGQDVLRTDEWGVDVVVSGSQKGFMLPPGLAFISLSPQAQEMLKRSNLPKYYFDLKAALKAYGKDDTPFTPAVSLIMGLQESLRLLKQENMEMRWKRFAIMANATAQAAAGLGLELFSKRPSSSVTAIVVPKDIKAGDIAKKMRKEYGVSIAAGQDDVKDKIIRIAHMGWINEQDLIMCFSLLEKVLKDSGYKFKMGSSLSRLQEVFYG